MTKIINTIIILAIIALVATFIVTAMSLQNNTNKVLSTYSARREELAGRQQQIQDMIVSLNSTLEAEAQKQQTLSSQINTVLKDMNTTLPKAPNTTINTPAPQVNKTPIIIPGVGGSSRKTRAS